MLALYYRDFLGYKPNKRKEELIKFCEKNIPDYSRAKYYKVINRTLSKSSNKSYNLVRIEKIDIYESEMKYLNFLEIDYDYKKILFAFLIHMRLNKVIYEQKNQKEYNSRYFKGGRKKYQTIKSMSNTPSELKINENAIYDLSQGNSPLITILYSGLIMLNFLDSCKQTGDVVLEVRDFYNVGWYFDYYNGLGKVDLCECGYPFKKNRKDQIKCYKCREYQPIETKTLTCVDCSKEFLVDSKANNRERCNQCIIEAKRKSKREWKQRNKSRTVK